MKWYGYYLSFMVGAVGMVGVVSVGGGHAGEGRRQNSRHD